MDRGGMSTSDVRLHAFSSGGSGLWVGEFVCLFCLILSLVCVFASCEKSGEGRRKQSQKHQEYFQTHIKSREGRVLGVICLLRSCERAVGLL